MPENDFRALTPAYRIDRAAHRRSDIGWLHAQSAGSARLIPVWRGRNLFSAGPRKQLVDLAAAGFLDSMSPVFLGLRDDETALFLVDLSEHASEAEALEALGISEAQFIDLRSDIGELTPDERSLLFYARSLALWSSGQKFCPRCGSPTSPQEAGHSRVCQNPTCASVYFPRTDPATIMLVHHKDRCLLGRQPIWPPGMYSTLAGFVEAGETVEEAVAREVKEESGIQVINVRYFASQPWPFPQSLMLGFFAEAVTTEIECGAELEDVRWFTRPETEVLLHRLAKRFPHLDTIARRLIRTWLEGME
jgi:NAD+ diphosphatase